MSPSFIKKYSFELFISLLLVYAIFLSDEWGDVPWRVKFASFSFGLVLLVLVGAIRNSFAQLLKEIYTSGTELLRNRFVKNSFVARVIISYIFGLFITFVEGMIELFSIFTFLGKGNKTSLGLPLPFYSFEKSSLMLTNFLLDGFVFGFVIFLFSQFFLNIGDEESKTVN